MSGFSVKTKSRYTCQDFLVATKSPYCKLDFIRPLIFLRHIPALRRSNPLWAILRGWTWHSPSWCPSPRTRTWTPASGWSLTWTRSGRPERKKNQSTWLKGILHFNIDLDSKVSLDSPKYRICNKNSKFYPFKIKIREYLMQQPKHTEVYIS